MNKNIQEKIEKVKKYLLQGFSRRYILLHLMKGEISEPTISKYLKDFELELTKKNKELKLTIIAESYKKHKGLIKYVCEELHCSRETVLEALNMFKIDKIDTLVSNQHSRVNVINESYFEQIDSYEKAYYLGLLYADGVVHMRKIKPFNNIVKISLKEEDSYILETLNEKIRFGKPMLRYIYKDRKGKPCIIFSISSKKTCLDLINLGCIERKSSILDLPFDKSYLNNKYFGTFLRGFFDGDGSSSFSKNGSIQMSFTSSHLFCNKLKTFIEQKFGEKCKIKNRGNYSMLIPSGRILMFKLYKFIYQDLDCNIHLKRKKANFDNYLDYVSSGNKRVRSGDSEILKVQKIIYV